MDDFIHWLSTTLANSHPLNYACEAHYRFVSIHPFADDNGRTGRLLMNLLLLRAGFPIVSISHQQREAYIQALVLAQQEHNQKEGSQKEQQPLTDLLTLILQAARSSLIETLSVAATAACSQGQGSAFYQEVVTFLSQPEKQDIRNP